ncbi:Mu transposase C-terminal domain-containing protein [Mesobacillus subterraneus]|uniref:transposase family protein n=1 Tax=Mesobacillus subterraneus TaxID=285983 RepID=UPI001CFDA853|nr:transposase family protein [Mesobacillus subterraneus]WLR55584.1 Mu transposase C-terminal domain-containing protein [Mesobacillus subterraneus]
MAGYYFSAGSRFLIRGNEYLVRKELERDYELENVNYEQTELWKKDELLQLWRDELLVFRKKEAEQEYIRVQNIDDLDEKSKKEAIRRYKILEPVIKGEILPSEIKGYVDSLNGEVKKSAFYEWKKRWECTEDIRALVAFKSGPKGPKISEDIQTILDGAIEHYLEHYVYEGLKYTIEDIHSEFTLRIDEENLNRDKTEMLNYVSPSKVRRRFMELVDIYKVDLPKKGTVLAKLKRDGVKEEVVATRPLQRVEIDWTPVDLMMIDPADLKPKRPNLIYAIDKCTGMPLGFFVTFKPVDSRALKQCLIHLIMPKTYLKELYPLVENEWVSHGIPHTIVVDNASVNDSYEFEEACLQLGVKEVQFCKIDAGHQKGTIERAFRRLNTMFIHNQKGTTFSNFIEKGRYDSQKKACITIQGFIYMAHLGMVDIVANSYDSRRGNSPHKLWVQGIEDNKRLMLQIPRSVESLKIILMGGSELRIIQQQGVVIQNEYFFSPELMELKNLLEKFKRGEEKVRVRFDLSDMRKVYVYDPINNKYITAGFTGLKRKKVNVDLPVPYQALELDSKNRTETRKTFSSSNRAKTKRKMELIREQEEKKVKKWKRNKGQVDSIYHDADFITETVLKPLQGETSSIAIIPTQSNINTPSINDEIRIIEEEQPVKQKNKKKSESQIDNEDSWYIEYEDTDVEDLPSWDVTMKKDKKELAQYD